MDALFSDDEDGSDISSLADSDASATMTCLAESDWAELEPQQDDPDE